MGIHTNLSRIDYDSANVLENTNRRVAAYDNERVGG